MRHSFYSILNANKLAVRRAWNLLAIFLILSTIMPAQSTPTVPTIPTTVQQHSSSPVQPPATPPADKPRPIFSRPEPILAARPAEQGQPPAQDTSGAPAT